MPNPVTVRYPLQPLADALGLTLDTPGLARRLNLSGTTWKEYRDLGVSERVADRLACKAGLHPFMVWPEMADEAVEAVHVDCEGDWCSTRFLPAKPWQRFCSTYCRERARRLRNGDRTATERSRRWREANPDERRRYNAEWMRLHRTSTHRSPSIPHTEGAEVGP
jgi:hypothetical protein